MRIIEQSGMRQEAKETAKSAKKSQMVPKGAK
jgi:hypothetical protein